MAEPNSFSGKTILVTGGTGSFGQKFVDVVLQEHDPRVLRVYSRDELKQFEMSRRLSSDCLRYFIGDVRDKDRLTRAMYGAQIVVHAAALKQVPAAEYNPIEAVKTNIDGTANVIDAALDCGVEKVMFLSSDKAVRPVNLYGATKLVAEKLVIQANSYAGGRNTRFSCVRYGNVVGSRGSAINLFIEQRETGVIKITDNRMTRFWITLDQGVDFVIEAIQRMGGGEVFVPKIPSMGLEEVARTIAPNAKRETIGIRAGEKLREELITEEEAPNTREFDSFYVVEPQHTFWDAVPLPGGQRVSEDFNYRSDTNSWWLTPDELLAAVDGKV